MSGSDDEERVALLGDAFVGTNLKHRFKRNAAVRRPEIDYDNPAGAGDFEPNVKYDEKFLNKYVADKIPDKIVAVFVVAFDTKAGNVMEWFTPEDVDMDGVEFKALTSGSHNMKTDFVYFKKGNLYGLACFERMEVENFEERGTRMKSVGILSTSHANLHQHTSFLEEQVSHQLKHPNDHLPLVEFWNEKKALIEGTDFPLREVDVHRGILSGFKASHPFHAFSHFFKFYGPQVFVLWKMALLGKRILFYSPPPIGVVCYRVYCTSELARHSRQKQFQTCPKTEAYFYINVADIDDIQSEHSYVACTTEKIFEAKPHLYDLYVDNMNVSVSSPSLKDILKVNDLDKERYKNLVNYRTNRAFSDEDDEEEEDEDEMFMNYFRDLNDRIVGTLLEVASSQDRQVTKDHVTSMNLHPQHDQSFVVELIETFAIDVVFVVDNPCCPT